MEFDNIFEGLKENKKTLLVVLILVIVLIMLSITNLIFGNDRETVDMEGILTSFAGIYYEEHYHPTVIKAYEDNYSEKLKEDEKKGIKLTLKEIISTFDDVDESKFYEEGNYCIFDDTYAVIYPKNPYNIKDYKIEVNVSCKKKLSSD